MLGWGFLRLLLRIQLRSLSRGVPSSHLEKDERLIQAGYLIYLGSPTSLKTALNLMILHKQRLNGIVWGFFVINKPRGIYCHISLIFPNKKKNSESQKCICISRQETNRFVSNCKQKITQQTKIMALQCKCFGQLWVKKRCTDGKNRIWLGQAKKGLDCHVKIWEHRDT